MPNKTYKRMTQREKDQRKRIRAELREQGLIPPVKPRLNRVAFCRETMQMWDAARREKPGEMESYLAAAIGAMIVDPQYDKVTPERIGVLKLIRIAVAYSDFEARKAEQGQTSYKIQELYDEVIGPILGM